MKRDTPTGSATASVADGGFRPLHRTRYRVRQGVWALMPAAAPLDRNARDAALAVLPDAAVAAFRALPRADQSHALRVHAALLTAGETDSHLLAAALLHDVGKHPGVGVTHRTAKVLLARSPAVIAVLIRSGRIAPRWRSRFARLVHHAALGADLAAAWGCTPETVGIVRASHDHNAPDMVRRLQAVDDRS